MSFVIEKGVLTEYHEEEGVTDVVIPDSVTSIGDRAFFDCTSLSTVTIPKSVKKIDACAFKFCTNLTSIIIPDSVTSIGYEAFCGCSSLINITIPDSITNIGSDAFETTKWIENQHSWCLLEKCYTNIQEMKQK